MTGKGRPLAAGEAFTAAVALHQQGRLAEAEALYRSLLQADPSHSGALHLLGLAHFQRGDPATAARLIGESIKRDGRNAVSHNNHGAVLLALGQFDEALAAFDRAAALKPDYAEALNNAGNALIALGRLQEALDRYEGALRLGMRNATLHCNRGIALNRLDRLDEALSSYDKAIAIDPAYADAHSNRATVFVRLKRYEEAVASCDQALASSPNHQDALRSKMAALLSLGRFEETIACCDRILALNGGHAEAHLGRALALLELYRHGEALPSVERALALAPGLAYARGLRLHLRMRLCEWSGFEADCENIVRATLAGEKASPPFAVLAIPSSPRVQQESARTFVRDRYPAGAPPLWRGEMYAHDRIRIAYLSADFHNHATAHLISGLLERHDRSSFEVTAFSFGPSLDDPWRRRLKAGVDRFVDAAAWTDERIASTAREMEIDIAVDLKGLTSGARMGILAMRPAPIQVNYLGYPGTLGADYIDYVIADPTVIPREHETFYTEKIAYLPDCYQANDSARRIAERSFSRAELGLPEGGFVFCCFNNSYKITPDAFDVWMRLLRQVPGSVLWLLATDRNAQDNLRRHAMERGVSGDRLVFAGVMEPDEHLARHRSADLFLDTFHYNAHTTASDALWAGLPVLTLTGDAFASRVASSLLGAIGLAELVTRTKADYEAAALELATTPRTLASLRAKLAANRATHPLFDTALFTRHIEAAFSTMHERHHRGSPPQRIVVPARTP